MLTYNAVLARCGRGLLLLLVLALACSEGSSLAQDECSPACPVGQQCVAGECQVTPCGGSVCLSHETCVDDRCVDAVCAALSCTAGEVCAAGGCYPAHCPGRPCAADEVCTASGCQHVRCIGVTCGANETCWEAACVSQACGGVTCGATELCVESRCIDNRCVGISCQGDYTCQAGVCSPPLCGDGRYEDNGVCRPQRSLGETCDFAQMCQSGHCADGRCCDRACTGGCESCSLEGSFGSCTTQPDGYPEPTCAPYLCGGAAACPTSCAGAQDCRAGAECDQGVCRPVTTNKPTSCSNPSQCPMGHCVDGYCCDTACDGACDSCDGHFSKGTCTLTNAGALCGDYRCNGASEACPTFCSQDSDCASGRYCDGLHCVPRLQNGLSCSRKAECASNQCVDGFCCNADCEGACDVCNRPGEEGTCAPQAGFAGNPSCAPASCSGNSPHCPVAAVVDGFNDNALDSERWAIYRGGRVTVRELNGRLEIVLPSGYAQYGGVTSRALYELTGSGAHVQMFRGPMKPTKNVYFKFAINSTNFVEWATEGSNLRARQRVNGTATNLATFADDPAAMRWLRIRESGGRTYWEYAPAVTGPWTVGFEKPTPIATEAVYLEVGAGNWQVEYDQGTSSFDDYNVP